MNAPTPDVVALRSVWVNSGGLSLHARVAADRITARRLPVLLIHGFVVSSRVMVPTALQLADDFPVFALDLPGFGESEKPRVALTVPGMADAVVAWMDTMGIRKAAFVGNSLGSQVVVDLAMRYPERATRLVLQGPTVEPNARTVEAMSRRLWRNMMQERSVELNEIARIDYASAGIPRIVRTATFALRDEIERKLPKIEAPALVVRGEHDPIISEAWAREVAGLLPRGRFVSVHGQGHTVQYLNPTEFSTLVRSFLLEDEQRLVTPELERL